MNGGGRASGREACRGRDYSAVQAARGGVEGLSGELRLQHLFEAVAPEML